MRTYNDPEAIVSHIIKTTRGQIRLALPLGLGKANTVVNALTDAAIADSSIRLEIFTALTLERPVAGSELEKRFLEPAMNRLFGNYPALRYAELLHEGKLPDNIKVNEFFLLAGKWLGVARVQANYIAANYTHAYDFLVAQKPNVVAQLLARDEQGFSLSCNTDISADLIAERRAGDLDFLMVGEVNSTLPFMGGARAEISEDEVDCLLVDPHTEFELFSSVKQPVTLEEHAIGLHISSLIADGGTLQIGIGSIGDAVANSLVLRHRDNAAWQRIMEANPFVGKADLAQCGPFKHGLYAVTEMLVDGLLQLFEAGILKREVDGAVIHAGFFVESRSFYHTLCTMAKKQRAKIMMMPVSFTNSLLGDEPVKRKARVQARFVNNAMLATLLGAVTSDGTGNGQVVSGVGGQFNFVTQAFALKDARSILTVKATRISRGKTASNIMWNYPHTTIPRHLKDIMVTQYGFADLRGKSDAETIAAMLAITDSRYQDELLKRAKAEGKIARDYIIPEAHRHNTPEQLTLWLQPLQENGKLSRFPFGTDFTDIEQRLLPALGILKNAQYSKWKLAGLLWTGLRSPKTPEIQQCLKRLELDAPNTIAEFFYALLIRGGLKKAG